MTVDEDSMIFYGALERHFGNYEQLEDWTKELEKEAGHSFTNKQLILLLKNVRDKGYEVVRLAVTHILLDSSVEDVAELVG